jgi:hypothetical protein
MQYFIERRFGEGFRAILGKSGTPPGNQTRSRKCSKPACGRTHGGAAGGSATIVLRPAASAIASAAEFIPAAKRALANADETSGD